MSINSNLVVSYPNLNSKIPNFLVPLYLYLSLKNFRFCDFVDRIYPIELEIKDSTDTDRSASYLEIDSEGWLRIPLWTLHLYVATFQQHLHMEYSSYHDFLAANKEATEPRVSLG